jgi:hypothetical protein
MVEHCSRKEVVIQSRKNKQGKPLQRQGRSVNQRFNFNLAAAMTTTASIGDGCQKAKTTTIPASPSQLVRSNVVPEVFQRLEQYLAQSIGRADNGVHARITM